MPSFNRSTYPSSTPRCAIVDRGTTARSLTTCSALDTLTVAWTLARYVFRCIQDGGGGVCRLSGSFQLLAPNWEGNKISYFLCFLLFEQNLEKCRQIGKVWSSRYSFYGGFFLCFCLLLSFFFSNLEIWAHADEGSLFFLGGGYVSTHPVK